MHHCREPTYTTPLHYYIHMLDAQIILDTFVILFCSGYDWCRGTIAWNIISLWLLMKVKPWCTWWQNVAHAINSWDLLQIRAFICDDKSGLEQDYQYDH